MPTVVVTTTKFVTLAELTRKQLRMPSLRLAVVEHPLGGIASDQVDQRADGIVDDVIGLLSPGDP